VERAKPVEVPDPSRTAGKRIGGALASGPKAPTFLFNSSSALSSLFSNVAAAVAWFFLPGLPCVLSLDLAMEVTMKVRVNLSMALHVVLRGKSVSKPADGGTKIRSFERTESDHVEVRILSPAPNSRPWRRLGRLPSRRLRQIDVAIDEAAKRGRTGTALSAMEAQRKARVGLAGERNEAAGTLWQS
jgi:hypothetical protein